MRRGTHRLEKRLSEVPELCLKRSESLASCTTFRIGGPAEWLVEVSTLRSLRGLLSVVEETGAPFCLLGIGSNLLIPDEGLPGVVARLCGTFRRWRVHGDRVSAGAAIPLGQLARRMSQRGLTGLEALAGFPSTVGGAVFMNAGSYGTEIRDLLVRATVVDCTGRLRRLGPEALGAGYRSTVLQRTGEIVTRVTLQLEPGDGGEALTRIHELNRKRWASLPSGFPNAGSIFKNPIDDYAGRLIEAVGLKGRVRGGAQISDKHANVIVNRGGALARDVLDLMAEVRSRVLDEFGVELEPEIVLGGVLRERWMQITEGAGVM